MNIKHKIGSYRQKLWNDGHFEVEVNKKDKEKNPRHSDINFPDHSVEFDEESLERERDNERRTEEDFNMILIN